MASHWAKQEFALLDRVPTGIRIGSEQATSVNLTLVAELPGDQAPQNS